MIFLLEQHNFWTNKQLLVFLQSNLAFYIDYFSNTMCHITLCTANNYAWDAGFARVFSHCTLTSFLRSEKCGVFHFILFQRDFERNNSEICHFSSTCKYLQCKSFSDWNHVFGRIQYTQKLSTGLIMIQSIIISNQYL